MIMKYYLIITLSVLSCIVMAADKTNNSDLTDPERKTVAAQARVASLQKASEEAMVKEFFSLIEKAKFLELMSFLRTHKGFRVDTIRERLRNPHEPANPEIIQENGIQLAEKMRNQAWCSSHDVTLCQYYQAVIYILKDAQRELDKNDKVVEACEILQALFQENGVLPSATQTDLPKPLKRIVKQYLGFNAVEIASIEDAPLKVQENRLLEWIPQIIFAGAADNKGNAQ